jgi:hypothetical protein
MTVPDHTSTPGSPRGGSAALGVVLLVVLVGLALVGQGFWRRGLVLMGAGLGLGAVLRLALPERRVGLLAVRSRRFDVAVLALLGAAIIAIAVPLPAP